MKKNICILFFAVALFVAPVLQANPGEQDDKLSKAIAVYATSLQHNNKGVVESTIFNVMRLKRDHANLDYSEIRSNLKILLINPPSQTIRYKAFIALNYLESPQHFPWIEEIKPGEPAESFRVLSEKLTQQLAGL
ncbi:MAG: hypothetical protein ACRBF0_21645 [Calditrichia bacterium]